MRETTSFWAATRAALGGRNYQVKAAGAALAAAVLLAGCSLGAPDSTVSPSASPSTTSKTSTAAKTETSTQSGGKTSSSKTQKNVGGTLLEGVSISPQEAGQIALDSRPSGQVLEVELEHSNGKAVWEVKVLAPGGRWEIFVDVSNGAIVGEKDESHKDNAEKLGWLKEAKLDFVQAIDAMTALVPGSAITEVSLEDHHGAVVWEGELVAGNQKHEVKIDATTGEVLKNEVDH